MYTHVQPQLTGFRYVSRQPAAIEAVRHVWVRYRTRRVDAYSGELFGLSDDEVRAVFFDRLARLTCEPGRFRVLWYENRAGILPGPKKFGKPKPRVRSNTQTSLWWRANWLNVRLGQPAVAPYVREQVFQAGDGKPRITCADRREAKRAERIAYMASKKPSAEERAEMRRIKREEREVAQRLAAAAKLRQAEKLKPKREREDFIKSQRDKRNGVEFESGRLLCAAGVIAGISFTRAFNAIRRASNKAEIGLGQIGSLVKLIEGKVREIKSALGKAIWFVPVVMLFYFIVSGHVKLNNLAIAAICAVAIKVLGKRVWAVVSKFFPDANTGEALPELQSGISIAAKLMTTVTTFALFGKGHSRMNLTELTKRIAVLPRAADGWEVFFNWVGSAFEAIVNYFARMFGQEKVTLIRKSDKAVKAWFDDVVAAHTAHSTAAVDLSPSEVNKLVSLVVRGNDFKLLYRGTPMERAVSQHVAMAGDLLMPHLGGINARNNFRVEPLACMFYGGPGIGKTRIATRLCAAVLMNSGIVKPDATRDEVLSEIWQKGNSEYWNSYTGQACLVMDDAFQQKADPTDKENEYMTLIRAVSSWSFPLNFADLNSKGKIFFGSKFIFGTTNVRSIWGDCAKVIHEPGAVARRLRYAYKLELRPEFATSEGFLDDVKYRQALLACAGKVGWEAFPWHIWEIRKHDFITGRTHDVSEPLVNLLVEMSSVLHERVQAHSQDVEGLGDFIDAIRPAISEGTELQAGDRGPRVISGRLYASSESTANVDFAAANTLANISVLAAARGEFQQASADFKQQSNSFWYVIQSLGAVVVGVVLIKFAFEMIKFIYTRVTMFLTGFFGVIFPFGKGDKQGEDKARGGPRAQSNRKLTEVVKTVNAGAEFQSGTDVICDNVYNNTYKMYVLPQGDSPCLIGQIIFLTGTLAVMPEHFLRELDAYERGSTTLCLRSALMPVCNKVEGEFSHKSVPSTYKCTLRGFLELERAAVPNMDICFVKFKDIRAHRNIVKSFIKESDIKSLGGHAVATHVCDIDSAGVIQEYNVRRVHTCSRVALRGKLEVCGKTIERTFAYDCNTRKGDCGAPTCLIDSKHFSGRTCLGFHVAGNTALHKGFAATLTQEMIEKHVASMDVIVDRFDSDLASRGVQFQSGNDLPFSVAGSFQPLGIVDRPVSLCPKTSYYRVDDIAEPFGPYAYRPAHLSRVKRGDEWVYPMEQAVKPYSTPLLIYEQPWLSTAVHVATRPLTHYTRECSRRIYSYEEAVLGVPEEKFRSIPRGTAAGYPYVLDVKNGKKEFFGSDLSYDLSTDLSKALEERVEYVLSAARKGERLSHVFVDFLKDELRSPAKVDAVATRLISSAPLDYVVAWRRMFGAFTSAVMRNHTKIGMAPGICAYTDWHTLATHLQQKGAKVFDGDFKAFDSSEQPTIMRFILDYINAWYNDGPENARVRRVLWEDLCHSRHIGGLGASQKYVYQWVKSLPSGHPFTTILNSIYSLVCLVGAYISVTGDLVGFWDHVAPATYGDDNVSNVSDNIADVFNQCTVALALEREFSLTYTPGRKDGVWQPYGSLADVTFLKRGFRQEDGQYVAPLEFDSFLYTCYWGKNRRLQAQITIDVLENTLCELALHELAAWQEYAPIVLRLMEERGHVPRAAPERQSYHYLVSGREDAWY